MTDNRLLAVLMRRHEELAPRVPAELIKKIAEIEELNQYDDERRKVLKELRALFESATATALEEDGD